MTADDIRAVRVSLSLTQAQFANFLGVHGLTVSKWERGLLRPTPYHEALIGSFQAAVDRKPDIGQLAAGLLVGAGVGIALYELLRAAFEPKATRK